MKKLRAFFKKETVLCIAAVCAVLTMCIIPPSEEYAAYIDVKVLCLLLCLMAVVAGFQRCGAFRTLAYQLLRRCKSGRLLGFVLVALPFFCSMLVTNDVALLTFVPFTLLLLRKIGCDRAIIPTLVLQTIAANLGSMATPVGNPQNLYLFAYYELTGDQFFSAILPLAALSFAAVTVASFFLLPKTLHHIEIEAEHLHDRRKLVVYALLFVLCLLTVFRVVHYGIMTAVVVVVLLVVERSLLKEPDYALLVTFVCFFIISGNLGRMQAVYDLLHSLLQRSPMLTALGASQVISNVPAAVLLSEFTGEWASLLQGVNIGGLGTPWASLASLITMKLYLRQQDSRAGRFLLVFLTANIAGLALLTLYALS